MARVAVMSGRLDLGAATAAPRSSRLVATFDVDGKRTVTFRVTPLTEAELVIISARLVRR